jgi:hypothetical protein
VCARERETVFGEEGGLLTGGAGLSLETVTGMETLLVTATERLILMMVGSASGKTNYERFEEHHTSRPFTS